MDDETTAMSNMVKEDFTYKIEINKDENDFGEDDEILNILENTFQCENCNVPFVSAETLGDHKLSCSFRLKCNKDVKQEPIDEYSSGQETETLSESCLQMDDETVVHSEATHCNICGKQRMDQYDLKQEPSEAFSAEQERDTNKTIKQEPNQEIPMEQASKDLLLTPKLEIETHVLNVNATGSSKSKTFASKWRIGEIVTDNSKANNIKVGKSGLFYCDLCGKGYRTREYATVHRKIHTHEKAYPCEICDRRFRRRNHLRDHMTTHTGEKPFQCVKCGHGFIRKSRLDMHMEEHVDEKHFKCPQCDKCFAYQHNVLHHLVLVHKSEDKLKHCPICDKAFTCEAKVKIHMQAHSDVKSHLCAVCGKTFKDKRCLKWHVLNIHAGRKPFPCKECDASFAYPHTLRKHMKKNHSGSELLNPGDRLDSSETHLCPDCGRIFTSYRGLKVHMTMHGPGVEKQLECTECGAKYKTRKYLKFHMLRHTSIESIPCPVCGKVYKTQRDVTVHMRTHGHMGRRYSCTTCGKEFKIRGHLNQHMSVHSADKPFKCTECNMGFKRKPNLVEHMRTHTGEKNPFQCTICDKSFVRNCLLQKHFATHSV